MKLTAFNAFELEGNEQEKVIPVRLFYGNPMEEQKGYAAITTIMANMTIEELMKREQEDEKDD